jgi:hypothetical protein
MLVMKKTASALTLTLALLLVASVGTLLVNFAAANIIVVPTNDMSVTVQSPENKVYTQKDVPLDFTVNNFTSSNAYGTWQLSLSMFTYQLDGQALHLPVTHSISGSTCYCKATLSNLSEGHHDLKITAIAEFGSYGMAGYNLWRKSGYATFTVNAVAPRISVLSFNQHAYNTTSLPLDFNVSESDISWMGYSLDGAATQTINGNTTLTGLSGGTHTIVVYATDTAGTTGASPSISFNIKTQQTEPSQPQGETEPQPPELFPTTWIVASLGSVAVASIGLIVYFAKVKKITRKVQ